MSGSKSSRRARGRARMFRWGVLAVAFVAITSLVTAHQFVKGSGKPVGVDALCPFGGLESLFALITGAGLIEKTAASGVVLLVGMVVMGLVARRSFCGQLCPLGAIQEAFGAVGRKLFGRKRSVPAGVDRAARYLKYAVLGVFLLWTWQAAELVMRPYDPWAALAHITSAEVLTEYGIGLTILGVSLAGSVLYDRFFCKYLCPTGAFLGMLTKLSVLGIRRDAESCTSCSKCDKVCPMNLTVSEVDEVTSAECISCNECVNACPVEGALLVKARSARVVSPAAATAVVTALIVVLVAANTVAGNFDWRVPSLAEAVAAEQEATGSDRFDTSLIKGRMSLQEVSEGTGIPAKEFTATFGVPAGELSEPMKDIKEQYGFTPEDVRAWVDERLSAEAP